MSEKKRILGFRPAPAVVTPVRKTAAPLTKASPNKALATKVAPTKKVKKATKKAAGEKPRRPVDVSAGLQGLLKKRTVVSANGVVGSASICKENTVGVGLKLPSFCLEALMKSTVWPLSRVTTIVGPTESGKSALMFEIIYWHVLMMGMGFIEEAESKIATELLFSLMRHIDGACEVKWCESMDAWQMQAMNDFNSIQAIMEGVAPPKIGEKKKPRTKDAPGRVFPFAIGIDSIVGKQNEETIEKTDKKGAAGRNFPMENQYVKQFVSRMSDRVLGWPTSVFLINHLKKKAMTGMAGVQERILGSSEFVGFQASIELEVNRIARVKSSETKGWEGIRSKIRTMKNSTGSTDPFPIYAEMWWRKVEDPETHIEKQETFWNWHKATMELLTSDNTGLKARTAKIVDINPVKPKNSAYVRYWSAALGIPKDEPVDSTIAGDLLMNRDDILIPLRRLYQIREDMPFIPGEDYVAQCKTAYARKVALVAERRALGIGCEQEDDGGEEEESA
jgi:hypothetical protein